MAKLSPKIEIINYFDNLIHQIDIDIEQSIEKYKEDKMLGQLNYFRVKEREFINKGQSFHFEYFDSNESSKIEEVIEWSESTKVIDYLNQIRQRTIDKLTKAQEDSLDYLKSKSCDLNHIKESKDIEEMKSRLFADKFYFQVLYKPQKEAYQDIWVFNLYTFVVDFYLSPSEIKFLEDLINCGCFLIYIFAYPDSSRIFDERFILIIRMSKLFWENLKTQHYPSHVINFRKQDLLNIKEIQSFEDLREINSNCSSKYFSKLEKLVLHSFGHKYLDQVNIEGLSSLKFLVLCLSSIEGNSFGNQNSLKNLYLYVKNEINNDSCVKLFETFPNIEVLSLDGKFSNINFDSFVNLKELSICGSLLTDFNFDLFKNICNQLERLRIEFHNVDDENIFKLFNRYNFPYVSTLEIYNSKMSRLEKKLFDRFPMLLSLKVNSIKELKTIDKDAFSNLKNLKCLELSFNDELSELDPELFSCLANLEKLHLPSNRLSRFDLKIMNYISKIKEINLENNLIENESELLDYCKQSNIKLKL